MSGDFNTVLDYSEFFANFRLNSNYSLITKLKRDDDSDSKIESVLGIGYENCCFVFRIIASDKNLSKYLDGYNPNTYTYLNDAWDNIIRIENKSRINFEFEFKGLNSSFEKVSRFMNNSILNY
jgi:lipopolysaccharide assembly outer membrane protein LptD (OstA)